MDCIVFDAEPGENGCALKQISGNCFCISLFAPSDGNGFLGLTDVGRGTGIQNICRYTIESGSLESSSINYSYIMDTDEDVRFKQENSAFEWLDISDLSGLEQLN